jgi:transcriptional regulator with XRE-family HTH domain
MGHAVRVPRRDVKRLVDALKEVIDETGWSHREFAERGGIAEITVQRVLSGKVEPRTQTLTGLDRAVPWPAGTARGLLLGTIDKPPAAAEIPTGDRTADRYQGQELEDLSPRDLLLKMIELLPAVERTLGEEAGDAYMASIMEVAAQADLTRFASSALRNIRGRAPQAG